MIDSTAPADSVTLRPQASQIDTIQGLVQPSMFWRPAYLAASAWLEHVPFAFWLVEALRPRSIVELGTHYGVSYFAFCQAVDRLGLDTRCFAIDTWKGDAHSGVYGEEVFVAVSAHNAEQYSAFSRLVRSTFASAVEHFQTNSVDLLHIDGLHTLESVRQDFTTWLPKLSDDAVVLFHDTNVRERGFAVSEFFKTIRDDYPCFEFVHGHGLGVACVGKGGRSKLKTLLATDQDAALCHAVRDLFGRLGRGVADGYLLREAGGRAKRLEVRLAGRESELAAAQAAVDDLASARREIVRLEGITTDCARALDVRFFELATLTERLERAEELASARSEITRIESVPAGYARALDERVAEVAALTGRLKERDRSYDKLLSYARKLERDHLAMLESTSWRALEPARWLMRRLRRRRKQAPFKPQL